MSSSERIAVTGASGQLGRLIVTSLLETVPAEHVVAIVRNPEKAQDLAGKGVEIRAADYEDASSLAAALKGIDRLVLVSANEIGKRLAQHRNVIEAAKAAGVKLLAYTSLLHADTSALPLAPEHKATEELIRASGIPYVLLRNGWYTENYTQGLGAALQNGAIVGAARDGRISGATRADFAAAAAAVVTSPADHAGRTYELAGDDAFTLADLAAEVSRQSGKPVAYNDLPQAQYAALLESFGLPKPFAEVLAECDALAAKGALLEDGKQLSGLIGRPTTPLAQAVSAALAG